MSKNRLDNKDFSKRKVFLTRLISLKNVPYYFKNALYSFKLSERLKQRHQLQPGRQQLDQRLELFRIYYVASKPRQWRGRNGDRLVKSRLCCCVPVLLCCCGSFLRHQVSFMHLYAFPSPGLFIRYN